MLFSIKELLILYIKNKSIIKHKNHIFSLKIFSLKQHPKKEMKPQSDSPPSYKEFIYSKQAELTQGEEPPYEELNEESDMEVYEQVTQMEDIYDSIRNEALLQKRLDQHYPIRYVLVHCVIMVIINVVLISLQIVAIRNDAAISYIGSAIWSGSYNLITVFMAILTSLFTIFF